MVQTKTPLHTRIHEICLLIDTLDPHVDCEEFAKVLLGTNPGLFRDLAGGPSGAEAQAAARSISTCQIAVIKEIPMIVAALLGAIDRKSVEPAIRCAFVGTLSYLVQPRDLLPDNLPGGFGFVDDSMILRAAASEFLDQLPAGFTTIDRERRVLDFLSICVPHESLQDFQMAIEGIWLAFHAYLWQPEDDVNEITEQLLNDPLAAPVPSLEDLAVPLPPGPTISINPEANRLYKEKNRFVIELGTRGSMVVDNNGTLVSGHKFSNR